MFKKRDVTRAIDAALKAGLTIGRVELEPGKIVIVRGEPDDVARPESKEGNEWDQN